MDNKIDTIGADGVRIVAYRTGHVKWRSDCATCRRYEETGSDPVGGWFPDHQAMRGCRSGGRDHCTCDGCF